MGHDQKFTSAIALWTWNRIARFLTHAGDIDIGAIDLMRPLIDSNFRIDSVHKLLKGSYFKNSTMLMIER